MLKEYIYNGESEEELKERLKNIFGEGCLYERCKYDSAKPPCGIIYLHVCFRMNLKDLFCLF